jgi:hypothetical protein
MALLPRRRKTTIEVSTHRLRSLHPRDACPVIPSPLGLRRTTVNLSMTMDNINKK